MRSACWLRNRSLGGVEPWQMLSVLLGVLLTHAALWFWNAEVSADLPGEVVIDFRVSWNRRCLAGGTDENRMVGAFPEQPTKVLLQVADQRAPFHALTLSGSRITGPWPVACRANSRL